MCCQKIAAVLKKSFAKIVFFFSKKFSAFKKKGHCDHISFHQHSVP